LVICEALETNGFHKQRDFSGPKFPETNSTKQFSEIKAFKKEKLDIEATSVRQPFMACVIQV
jgi:hypothetical protein